MGTFAYPVGIRIEDVKNKFGSKDEMLLEEITKENPDIKDELEDILFNYVAEPDRKQSKTKLFGLIKSKDGSGLYSEWYEYFYALMTLTQTVGENFCGDSDIFKYGSSWWQTIDAALKQIDSKFRLERMAEYNKLFDTPFEQNEGCTNMYDRTEINAFYDDFLKINSFLDTTDEELMDFYNEFKSALTHCKDNNLDLVTFMC
jgi:hypothetical protein